jgi:hypothetical protein
VDRINEVRPFIAEDEDEDGLRSHFSLVRGEACRTQLDWPIKKNDGFVYIGIRAGSHLSKTVMSWIARIGDFFVVK